MKYVKNATTKNYAFLGQQINAGEYYALSTKEIPRWASDDEVAVAISQGILVMAKDDTGNSDYGILESLNYLQNEMPSSVKVTSNPPLLPFAQKVLEDGQSLYRRKHGFSGECAANSDTVLELQVPYAHCKIDEVEIVGSDAGDLVDLQVLDSDTGAIQAMMGVPAEGIEPKKMLNQFGFDVFLPDLFYSDSSNYDADLYYGMFVKIIFKNKTSSPKTIGINAVLHEVK